MTTMILRQSICITVPVVVVSAACVMTGVVTIISQSDHGGPRVARLTLVTGTTPGRGYRRVTRHCGQVVDPGWRPFVLWHLSSHQCVTLWLLLLLLLAVTMITAVLLWRTTSAACHFSSTVVRHLSWYHPSDHSWTRSENEQLSLAITKNWTPRVRKKREREERKVNWNSLKPYFLRGSAATCKRHC